METDEQIALAVQKGGKEKFAILMERYKAKIFRYGKNFLSNEDNLTDEVQEVFIRAYQNIRSFDSSQKFSPWIYRVAHNIFINAIKKEKRGPVYLFDFDLLIPHPVYEDPQEKEKEFEAMKQLIGKGLEKLNSKYREIIVLYYLEELSYKEVAEILRIPVGTVAIRLKRAKEALKKILPEEKSLEV